MQNQDPHIIIDKELRRDIDAIIQRLKTASERQQLRAEPRENDAPHILPSTTRASRERSLAVTKLQEAVMWLGMDLKAINDENPQASVPPKSHRQCAEEAYQRYGAVTDFKNFRGEPMPAFADLGDNIQAAWEAAATVHSEPIPGNPYPNSKDPSNTKIDPTADGLKL